VDGLPPKIRAIVGTTIMDTPGTPVFDIPISMAHNRINSQSSDESEKEDRTWIMLLENMAAKVSQKCSVMVIFPLGKLFCEKSANKYFYQFLKGI
jgi:hypothetical protein